MRIRHSELSVKALPPAIFLMGPTASGKTNLAVHLVERFPLEVVSVDSAQIYRGMDIGTAKPGPEILRRAPHHLLDIRDPAECYSAAEFRTDALKAMAQICAAGRVPLLVGGTGLYFLALRYGLSKLPAADPAVRARLVREADLSGWDALHRRLAQVDPSAAARIHPHDPQRIQRALEVWELTGRPLSEQQRRGKEPILPYRVLCLVRAPRVREALRRRIVQRFRTMLEKGFEQEVRRLLARGDLSPAMPSLRSVGYRQMVQYLLNGGDYADMVARGITATQQLAKRQLTWLRAESDAYWLHDEDENVVMAACAQVRAWLGG